MKASSPSSNDDFRMGALRKGASDVFCMDARTVPCDLAAEFATEDVNDLLFGICIGGFDGASLEGGFGV